MVSACIAIECVPVRDASLGIVREAEKLTGGLGAAGVAGCLLLVLDDMAIDESIVRKLSTGGYQDVLWPEE